MASFSRLGVPEAVCVSASLGLGLGFFEKMDFFLKQHKAQLVVVEINMSQVQLYSCSNNLKSCSSLVETVRNYAPFSDGVQSNVQFCSEVVGVVLFLGGAQSAACSALMNMLQK